MHANFVSLRFHSTIELTHETLLHASHRRAAEEALADRAHRLLAGVGAEHLEVRVKRVEGGAHAGLADEGARVERDADVDGGEGLEGDLSK